jgi:hypothetical protein
VSGFRNQARTVEHPTKSVAFPPNYSPAFDCPEALRPAFLRQFHTRIRSEEVCTFCAEPDQWDEKA